MDFLPQICWEEVTVVIFFFGISFCPSCCPLNIYCDYHFLHSINIFHIINVKFMDNNNNNKKKIYWKTVIHGLIKSLCHETNCITSMLPPLNYWKKTWRFKGKTELSVNKKWNNNNNDNNNNNKNFINNIKQQKQQKKRCY